MNNKPLVSIIMPAYNAEKYIAEAIESIISQTYTNWELLIGDDKSRDATAKIINRYLKDNRIRFFEFIERSNSPFELRNYLINKANGGFIAFQDADDWSHPERIEKQLKTFLADDTLGITGCNFFVVNQKRKCIHQSDIVLSKKKVCELIKTKSIFKGPTVMIKKKLFDKIGGFRMLSREFAYQDYDLCMRAIEFSNGYILPEPLYYYRIHANSISHEIKIKRHISYKIVQFLHTQRMKNGTDGIDNSKLNQELDDYIKNEMQPYMDDKSKLFREYAGGHLSQNMTKMALMYAFMAINKEPLNIINWRTFFYIVRQTITK